MRWLVGFALLVSPSWPQTDQKTRITLDVTRVNLLVTVTDRRGNFAKGLSKDDFEVLENGRPQRILEFSAETDLPLRMAVLVDTSNSVRDRFRFIQEAAVHFIHNAIRPGRDQAMAVSFDSQIELVAGLTDDLTKLDRSIRDLRAGRGTALYDAIRFACLEGLVQGQPRHRFRRAMVIVSDGDDNDSSITRSQALEMAHKADAVIYALSSNFGRTETRGDKVLTHLASETGGLALFPREPDLAGSFAKIAGELRHQYSLLYRPDPLAADGQYHAVEVRVKERKGLLVRARKGYYAPRL